MMNSKLSMPSQMSKRDITSVLTADAFQVLIGFCNLKTVPTLAKLNKKFLKITKDNKRLPLFKEVINELRILPYVDSLDYLFREEKFRGKSKTYLYHLKKKISKMDYQSTQKEDFMTFIVQVYLKKFSHYGNLNLMYVNLGEYPENFVILLEALKESNKITKLDLRENKIANPMALKLLSNFFKFNKTITHLNLSMNEFGKEKLSNEFFKDLLMNNFITKLNLSGNLLNESKGKLKTFFEALKVNTTITILNLSKNALGREPSVVKLLIEAMEENQTIAILDLRENEFKEDDYDRLYQLRSNLAILY